MSSNNNKNKASWCINKSKCKMLIMFFFFLSAQIAMTFSGFYLTPISFMS